jgi:high affinity sulfate transporter 1
MEEPMAELAGTNRALSAVAAYVPGITAFRQYDRRWLGRDVLGGLVLTALLVPQGMAYAELAGLPAVTGLYTSILCLIGYAIFGPSRVLVLGPDSSLGPMIAATILPLLVADGDPARAVVLASMLSLIVGAILVVAGLGHLGLVADLLSRATQIGYMNGLALTIIVGQLPKLFGFSTDADGLIAETRAFVEGLLAGSTITAALVTGLVALALIFVLPRWLPRIPAVLIAVVVTTAVAALTDLAAKGVALVGVLPQGLPSLEIPTVPLSDIGPLALGAMGIALVALTDTVSTSSAFAAKSGQEVRADQEMVGIGAASLAAGLFQGFPVSTSGSRTAVAYQVGARSQLAGVVGAAAIAVMLLFIPGLLQDLPQPTLAAVVIAAALSLADLPATRRLWHQRRSEWLVAATAFAGVALLGVLPGIAIAVALSVANVFRRVWWSYRARLGRVEDVEGFHDVTRYPQAAELDGLVLLRFDGPLFFANARSFRETVRALALEQPTWLCLTAEPVTDIDPTAADMLVDLAKELDGLGVRLVFAELKDPVRLRLNRYGLGDSLDDSRFFPTIDAAVRAYQAVHPDATWHVPSRKSRPPREDLS